MSRRFLTRLFPLAFLGALLLCRTAFAQVFLKPNGQGATPLRLKSLSADVTIDRAFAASQLTLTFQNETSDRIEADFMMTLPPSTLVTSFAYWYGEEKVTARIVEKERAAEIYKHITTRMRDPALIEMVGKNTFRARIFPVMPNSDLKVEMRLVQTLASDRLGLTYDLPLRMDKGDSLDSIHVQARVKPDESIERVENSYSLSVVTGTEGHRMVLDAKNYRPPHDLRIRLYRKPKPLHAALYAARSGGEDGFFALALTPDRAVEKPRVTIRGVRTYQVVPLALPGVKAHERLTVCGRYRGSGPATVTLTGSSPSGNVSLSAPLHFGADRVTNNLASKLWAAGRIEQLSAGDANRAAILALSLRYALPSKHTSWLAVPKAEMERYKQEKLEAEIAVAARQLAREIANGRENSRSAQAIKRRLRTLSRQLDRDHRSTLENALSDEISELGRRYVVELNLGRERSETARRLRAAFYSLCRWVESHAHPTWHLENAVSSMAYGLAEEMVKEAHRDRPNRMRMTALRKELRRITDITGVRTAYYLDQAEYSWSYMESRNVGAELVAEYGKDRPDQDKIRQLMARYNKSIIKVRPEFKTTTRSEIKTQQRALDQLSQEIEAEKAKGDSSRVADLERRRTETLSALDYLLRVRMGDPLITVEAPADAEQVIAIMPDGEIKRLVYNPEARKWEARFNVPAYATEGKYVITLVIVLKDGTRQTLTFAYQVNLTPPTGAGQALVVAATQPTLRLELDASDDTARVSAVLPWGEQIVLKPSAQAHRFFALVTVPEDRRGRALTVKYVLTDRAHNRTVVTVDAEERP